MCDFTILTNDNIKIPELVMDEGRKQILYMC